jgi:hypothetical protein
MAAASTPDALHRQLSARPLLLAVQELNSRGSHLLFRDKRQRLHLLEVASQQRSSLQDFCQFVQLLPGSDILVAQSRASLCVWYNIDRPDRRTCVPIKGDVEGIQRVAGRTQVLVGGGCVTTAYTLDEGLVAFGAALEAQVTTHTYAHTRAHTHTHTRTLAGRHTPASLPATRQRTPHPCTRHTPPCHRTPGPARCHGRPGAPGAHS